MEPRCLKKTPFREVPTAQKCCKKQYGINIFVLNAWKKHSRIECKPHAHRDIKSTTKTEKCIKKTPFREVPTAPKCCKKQYEIKIFVLSDWKKHSRIKYKPHARQDIKFTKKTKKCLKIAPFRQALTAQKCCKKQYRIKIFLLHDENMTKSTTHAPRANHDKGLRKTLQNVRKNTFSKIAHSAKVL